MATLTILVRLDVSEGVSPQGSLFADGAGNLYGTASSGGDYDDGTAFEIVKTATGYASTATTLVSFDNTDGAYPASNLIADSAGNLYGTTYGLNIYEPSGDGTVFEIAKTADGYASTPTTLVSFDSTDGAYPVSGLIADAAGNLYGTTSAGGADNAGTVFEIAKTANGYASTPTTLVSFDYTDGYTPKAGLIADADGNLYGTTTSGGDGGNGYGTVFEIAKTATGYASTPTTLVTFDNTDGATPGGLIADADGNLYGTTRDGGADASGTVFEIAKTANGYASTPTTLVTFDSGDNGGSPAGSLIADAAGNLYGTTEVGGAGGSGTVFEIAKTATGYASTPTTLATFDMTEGAPFAGLIADAAGNLYGTTGGSDNSENVGTVFEVSGSPYVICYLQGTAVLTPKGERKIEDLQIGDLVVTRFNGLKPVLWVGRQTYSVRTGSQTRDHSPVHFRPGSLGDNLPARDLYVSPGHSMLVGQVLVLAQALVNGVTITQDWKPEFISYYQIELDIHDCILAEGTWSETFADGPGLRDSFHNADDYYKKYLDHCPPEDLVSLCSQRPLKGTALEAALRPRVAAAMKDKAVGPLRGLVDVVVGDWRLEGWAQDLSYPEAPVLLEILSGGRILGEVLACHYRSDLEEAGIGAGRASFSFKAPVKLTPDVIHELVVQRQSDQSLLPMNPDIFPAARIGREPERRVYATPTLP